MYQEDSTSHWDELGLCSKYIVNTLGVPPNHLKGFRTPYLAYKPVDPGTSGGGGLTHQTIKNLGMIFDATMENGSQSNTVPWIPIYFPSTLDKPILDIGITPGLWQVPHVNFIRNSDVKVEQKGFDSGLWPAPTPPAKQLNLTGPEALEYFVGTLDLHYGLRKVKHSYEQDSTILGNRAPMDIGLHSDYYSFIASDPNHPNHNPEFLNMNSTVAERRKALKDFVDYALTLPDVRFVTFSQVIQWMKNPVELTDLSLNSKFEYSKNIVSLNMIEKFSEISANEGEGSSFEILEESADGLKIRATVDNSSNYVSNRQADLELHFPQDLSGIDGITITYTSDFPLHVSFVQSELASDESSYMFALPKTRMEYINESNDTSVQGGVVNNRRTHTIPVSDITLERPYWKTTENIPFDLSKVNYLAISPMASDTVKTGTFTINNLQVFGSGKFGTGEISIEDKPALKGPKRLSVAGVYKNTMQLQIPVKGTYNVELFTPSGRKVFTETRNFSAGINSLGLSALSNGAYFVRMNGNGITVSDRFILQ